METLKKYSQLIWWIACGSLAFACMALAVMIWLSGGHETEDAFSAGRRVLIAVDTGEVQGRIITLDKPLPPVLEPGELSSEKPPPKVETPAGEDAAKPADETPAGETPPDTPQETSQDDAAATPAKPATPMPDMDPSLTEKTESGSLLPMIGKDGTKPWRAYSKPFERKRNQPMVAIVVTGLGINRAVTQEALDLHEYVSLSFSPYTRDLKGWLPAVRASGHEILIDLPLEPTNYPLTDPGPRGLLLERGDVAANQHMQSMMVQFPTSMGFLTPQNESFTANEEAIKLLLQSLGNRGLMLIMGREPHKKEIKDIIDGSHTAHAIADVLIDEELAPVVIQARLTQLEDQARKRGYAIGIAQPYPVTMEQLKAWQKSLAEKDILLVPVSAIVKLHFS